MPTETGEFTMGGVQTHLLALSRLCGSEPVLCEAPLPASLGGVGDGPPVDFRCLGWEIEEWLHETCVV